MRQIVKDAAGTPEAEPPAQGATLHVPTHMAAPSHGLVLREGPKPTRPRGRIPRVGRLLALAHHFDELLKTGAVETQAELAELAKLTPARVTQIMNLLGLAPDIQEEIFFLRGTAPGWNHLRLLLPGRHGVPQGGEKVADRRLRFRAVVAIERDHQLEQRMAELRDELAAVQRESVPAAQIQRAVALFDPVWDLLLVPERFRILHLLLKAVVYDGSTGELKLAFYPIGITSFAVEAVMVGQSPEGQLTRRSIAGAGCAEPDTFYARL